MAQSIFSQPLLPPADRPKTVDMAVRVLMGLLDQQALNRIAALSSDDLIDLHFSAGAWVRNWFGLWQADSELYRACAVRHPDDASMVILEALWLELQPVQVPLH